MRIPEFGGCEGGTRWRAGESCDVGDAAEAESESDEEESVSAEEEMEEYVAEEPRDMRVCTESVGD